MAIAEVTSWKKVCDIVSDSPDYPYCLEILCFFKEHPYTRFNQLAILHSIGKAGCNSSSEKALRNLIGLGIVEECVENTVHLYSLSKDETLRSQVMKLAK
jgi:hypothetical protein